MSEKNKKVCRALNYFEHFPHFISAVSRYVSISAFVSLVSVLVGIASSAVIIKLCAITAGIKNYKSVIKKKKKKHDKIVLLSKTKLNTIKTLISKSLRDSYINHDELLSVSNVLRKYNEMKEEAKNPKNAVEYTI